MIRITVFTTCLMVGLMGMCGHAIAETDQASDGNFQRIMTTPMEPLLPCKPEDERIIYTLKAADGFNIQVAIECSKGKLTAHWPLEEQPNSNDEAP